MKPQSELSHVKVQLSWSAKNDSLYGIFDLDISAFLLNAQNKVVRNEGFIFYGNLRSPCGSIHHSGDDLSGAKDKTLAVRLSNLPKDIHKVRFVVSLHGGHSTGQVFGKTDEAAVRILDANRNEEIAYFDLDDAQGDRSVFIGDLTRCGAGWTWKTHFNGSDTSLESIAKTYGVDTKSVRLSKQTESPIFHFWCRRAVQNWRQKKKKSEALRPA